ncbi:hypothetical protein GWA01_18750 [Gluconobacter wancherniae NBRC 103581]|uniref:Uncharacterized protein n=1 Tax=Gluconobacter wancherniae NBRC 103581 TaxID=656744 RepID=A0A511B0X2_9PROT|nr:hypothetical protein AA103581_1717 [Gluconobacter wancherniae NBRC 103581]GEK94105.1 hypothetical protein GWA01_18750 [Gluconobacter wancherniae NBRC 103581]
MTKPTARLLLHPEPHPVLQGTMPGFQWPRRQAPARPERQNLGRIILNGNKNGNEL